MSATIEALFIFDNSDCVLEHTYTARSPSAADLASRLKEHPSPRPPILHLHNLIPPTTVFSARHNNLDLICTSSRDVQSFAILELLYRLIDVFEDFLGSPLLASKIEENYEIVAQLLNEMCDGGVVCNTEGNALREQVEMSSALGKLFTHVGLPGSSPAIGPSNDLASRLKASSSAASGPAIPWRKNNVRHTSNELYVDIVEDLSVIFAPSGRPISARARGSMLFTAKISGVPELSLILSAPGGTSSDKSSGISRTMQMPVFHPCVRLARWKDRPGELSFVPPDGKFMLAGYESDLMPSSLDRDEPPSRAEKVFLPVTIDFKSKSSTDFEARLTLNTNFPGVSQTPKSVNSRTTSTTTPFSFGSASSGSSNAPTLEALVVTIPFPPDVRAIVDLKPSRGEAVFNGSSRIVEWKIPTKDGATVTGVASLCGSIIGAFSADDSNDVVNASRKSMAEYCDDDVMAAADGHDQTSNGGPRTSGRKPQPAKAIMPGSIAVSFSVKGWLASGIKVDSLLIDVKKSRGLGDGVKPYKGVKYLTVSKKGVERRIQ